ncbi:WG repeat-containing protein [bacterium]|nr:WG repeat-containing protein [bacterium]
MNISTGGLYSKTDKKTDSTKNVNKEILTSVTFNNVKRNLYKFSKFEKVGLIDDNGRKIIKPLYDDIIEFDKTKGLYKTKLDGKFGLININSGVLIPAKFQDIEMTQNEDVVSIKNYKYYGLYDIKKRILVLRPIYLAVKNLDKYNWKIFSNHKMGLVYSKEGNTVLVKPKYIEIEPYKNVFKTDLGEKVGLISYQNGEVLTEPVYDNIELINDENADILIFRTTVDKRYGVIYYSSSGDLTIIAPVYQDVQYKGRVNVLSDGYWRILDNKGNVTAR